MIGHFFFPAFLIHSLLGEYEISSHFYWVGLLGFIVLPWILPWIAVVSSAVIFSTWLLSRIAFLRFWPCFLFFSALAFLFLLSLCPDFLVGVLDCLSSLFFLFCIPVCHLRSFRWSQCLSTLVVESIFPWILFWGVILFRPPLLSLPRSPGLLFAFTHTFSFLPFLSVKLVISRIPSLISFGLE